MIAFQVFIGYAFIVGWVAYGLYRLAQTYGATAVILYAVFIVAAAIAGLWIKFNHERIP
jgi:hypothetical protein